MRFTIKVAILALQMALVLQPGFAMLLPQDYSVRAAFEILIKTDAVYDRMIGSTGMIDHTLQEMGIRRKIFNIPPAKRPVKR
jgi:hypothetical protein